MQIALKVGGLVRRSFGEGGKTVSRPTLQQYRTITVARRSPCYRCCQTGAAMVSPTLMYGRRYQKGLNGMTTVAMVAFHAGAVAALFFVDDRRDPRRAGSLRRRRHARHRHGLSPAADAPRLQRPTGGWNTSLRGAARSRSRGGRSSGWRRIASTTSTRIAKAIRTRRARARGGRTWAGSAPATGCTTTRRCSRDTRPDLVRDPVHVALSKWHWTSNVIVGLGLLAYGGLPYVLWGIFFRTTVGLHATWLVNSATHKWGARRFDDARRLHQQLVGRAPDVRRGLAQQPSRPPDERASRPRVVRGGRQLGRYPHAPGARPGMERQARRASDRRLPTRPTRR